MELWFVRSKTELDIWGKTLCIWVASGAARVVHELLQELHELYTSCFRSCTSCTRVDSGVVWVVCISCFESYQRLNTMKLRNTKKVLKLNGDSISSAPSKEKTLVILAKHYEKTDVKVFCSHQILFNSFTLVQIFFSLKISIQGKPQGSKWLRQSYFINT